MTLISWITVPTALSLIRLVGSPIAIVAALVSWPGVTWIIILCLVLTDWLDGMIARLWHQETATGSLIDTVADVALGIAMVACLVILVSDQIWAYRYGIAVVGGSYLASVSFSLFKFRRWPAYHTYLAKGGMVLVSLAGLSLLSIPTNFPFPWVEWPTLLALITVTIGNFEACAITGLLQRPQSNVPSWWLLWRQSKRH